jgi:hypothetical protein
MSALHVSDIRRKGALLAGLAALLAGCSNVRNYEPQLDPETLDGTTFLHYLGTVPVVSVEEGCRAILLVADGVETFGSYPERYDELVRRGVIRTSWGLRPDHVLDKGTLAYMAARVCKLPRGVNSHLLGSWGLGDRRYAMRDVIAAGIMPYDVPEHAVRGGELLAALGKIDEYLAADGGYEAGATEATGSADTSTPSSD